METLLLIIRLALFGVFALAAIGKLMDREGSEKAMRQFGVSDTFAKLFAHTLPVIELVIAFGLLFTATSWYSAVAATVLLLAFTVGMAWQMAKGKAPDCHCFGQIHSEPVSGKSLARNAVFVVLALVLTAQGSSNQGPGLAVIAESEMQAVLLLLLLLLGAAVLLYLRKAIENQTEILRRIELLEVVSREGVALERHEAGSPHDGLPIGAPFPDFELPDVSGRRVTLRTMTEAGRPVLVLFVSPTCEPCKALIPELERWEAELADRVSFVLLSSGGANENAGKFGVFSDEVVLQEKREIAELLYARWTPTAVFVRSDGTIGSHPAAGDVAIRELVDKIRAERPLPGNAYFANGTSNNGLQPPKIGEPLPDFTLTDLNDRRIRADELRGRRTLAVFWSPTCPHCKAMMDDLKNWDRTRTEKDPGLIVFSDGDRDLHADLSLNAPVVLDAGYKTAETLGMFGTPSGVLFDEDGRFASETALGATNIWALIGKRK